jgi:hypothetical protein
MQTNRLEVSKHGNGKTLYIPLSVYRAGKGFTISCSDPTNKFRFGTSDEQLQKFRSKLEELFVKLVERPKNNPQSQGNTDGGLRQKTERL